MISMVSYLMPDIRVKISLNCDIIMHRQFLWHLFVLARSNFIACRSITYFASAIWLTLALSKPLIPHIISAETFLFWIWKSKGHTTYSQRSQYINVLKLFKGGNYSRAETIWGNTVIPFSPPSWKRHFLKFAAHTVFPRIVSSD